MCHRTLFLTVFSKERPKRIWNNLWLQNAPFSLDFLGMTSYDIQEEGELEAMVKYADLKNGNINASHQRPTKRVAVCRENPMKWLGLTATFKSYYSYL